MGRVCEEFHLSVRQALIDLAVPDLGEFDAELVAEESAAMMFEIMEYRAFAAAKRAYQAAKPEDQPQMALDDSMVAIAQEIEFEIAGERLEQLKQRRAKR